MKAPKIKIPRKYLTNKAQKITFTFILVDKKQNKAFMAI